MDVRLTTVGNANRLRPRRAPTCATGRRPALDATITGLDLSMFPVPSGAWKKPAWCWAGAATARGNRTVHLTTAIRHELEGRAPSVDAGRARSRIHLRRACGRRVVGGGLSSLALLGAVVPALQRLGDVSGPIRLRGPRPRPEAELRSTGGSVRLDGWFDLSGPRPRFSAEGHSRIPPDRIFAGSRRPCSGESWRKRRKMAQDTLPRRGGFRLGRPIEVRRGSRG